MNCDLSYLSQSTSKVATPFFYRHDLHYFFFKEWIKPQKNHPSLLHGDFGWIQQLIRTQCRCWWRPQLWCRRWNSWTKNNHTSTVMVSMVWLSNPTCSKDWQQKSDSAWDLYPLMLVSSISGFCPCTYQAVARRRLWGQTISHSSRCCSKTVDLY
jgi:hypothetical protein